VPTTKYSRPSGFLGHAQYYAKETFYLLFMNGPSTGRTEKVDRRIPEAVRLLDEAAEQRNPDALFLLAEMNFYGNFTHPRNYSRAFEHYQSLTTLTGNSTAQYMLGFMYATGMGGAVERHQGKALLYHTYAAMGGNTRSQMTLGFRRLMGIGASRDCDQAAYYYKLVADKAVGFYRSGPPGGRMMKPQAYRWADDEGGIYGEGASVSSSGPNALKDGHAGSEASVEDVMEYLDLLTKKGDIKATFSLGKMYYEGTRQFDRNFRKAMQYFVLVARRYWGKDGKVNPNHPVGIEKMAAKAAGHIGLMFLRGEGTEQNFDKAAVWFRRGIASGDSFCQHYRGLMYLHGYGVPKDPLKAASYFKASSEQDFPPAEVRLGALFLDQGDVSTAARYFELAARYQSIEAFYYLAEISDKGIGRERHCGVATGYYKLVAERAEDLHSSFAEANTAYENGDRETALVAAMMAAEQGYESAQANVAYLLDEQRSFFSLDPILPWKTGRRSPVLKNAALALIYWTRAARQRNIDSLVKMGDYYLRGYGTPVDIAKASSCYHTAAEGHNSAQAFWNLGWMYENGMSVEQDFHMAKRYYDFALETNDEAYLPVKLSLLRLRVRSFWNRITHGKANSIQTEPGESYNYLLLLPSY
jgi:SEL1 protein